MSMQVSTQLPWDAIATISAAIITVIIAIIGIYINKAKRKREVDNIRKALVDELDNIESTLVSSSVFTGESFISNSNFPFVITTYESVKANLPKTMGNYQLSVIHRAYEEVKKLNAPRHESPRGYRQHQSVCTGYFFDRRDIVEVQSLVEKAIEELMKA